MSHEIASRRRRSFLPVIAGALVLVAASAAPAAADPNARTAEVELIDTEASGTSAMVMKLALMEDRGPATLTMRRGDVEYEVKVWREAGKKGTAALILELVRTSTTSAGTLRFRGTSSAKVGERVTLLRLERPDGSRYEVAVTLQ